MTPITTDSTTVLTGMYAAEAEYLAAGGPGSASFDPLAPFFHASVVLHQAENLPYGGTWRGHDGMERLTITVVDGRIAEVRPFYWDTAAVAAACGVSIP
ncbi:hypothetical protein [Nocardia gamkensis]|uniref:SnoaL-like domain-containing protein n=1 Tax=Nocardia gamkensis TaxID=352869 RepID=A0A7X6L9L9_9NOCA|nr:hypothetical protein [Nocardia gamkensis]NKY30170.1 hypothetical protein [Nocardia gamkensis]